MKMTDSSGELNFACSGWVWTVQWQASAGVLLPLPAPPGCPRVSLPPDLYRHPGLRHVPPLPPLILHVQTEPDKEERRQGLLNSFIVASSHCIVIIVIALQYRTEKLN